MQERLQFLCGAGSLLLWLVTFLFIVGYADHSADLKLSWTTRTSNSYGGFSQWRNVFNGPHNTWVNASKAALSASGCLSPTSAPLCQCLVLAVTQSPCQNIANAAVDSCYFSSRPSITTSEVGTATRPYMWILAINSWASLVGTTLLVKSKLLDRGSYAIQIMIQIILVTLTVGTQWVMFAAPPEEWAVTLGVSLGLIMLGWSPSAGDDDADWWVLHLSLLYTAVLPALNVLYNALNQRRDILYMLTTTILSLGVALIASVRSLLERSKCGEQADDPVMFCDVTLKILTLALVGFSYDVDTANLLQSSIPSWWAYAIYLGLSFASSKDAGFVYMSK